MEILKKIKDVKWIGWIVGVIQPPIVVVILAKSVDPDLVKYSKTYLENISLFAIMLNAMAMWFFLNFLRKDEIGKGIMHVTLLYALAFVIYFYI